MLRQRLYAVGVNRGKQRIIDQMVVDQFGAGAFRQFTSNRVFAGAGKSDQQD
jgi:hypothetical protein